MRPDAFETARRDAPESTGEIRVETRALAGMQKEAVVTEGGPSGSAWRLVSDEGPYLNGTDLAPFPLAFFTAGLQFSLMAHLPREARVTVQNRYTMNGSILRGTMKAGALPAEFSVRHAPDPGKALAASPAEAAVREPLKGAFFLHLNGTWTPHGDVTAPPGRRVSDPGESRFETLERLEGPPDRVTKVDTGKRIEGVEGGAGSSLKPEQKRQLHMRGEAGDGATVVRLIQPLGSTFRFVGTGLGLVYLSAGVAFCFMTQLSRYAAIVKLKIDAIRTVQFHRYDAPTPVETHVFIESGEPAEKISRAVEMGEQTCFLHAALRERVPSVISAAP